MPMNPGARDRIVEIQQRPVADAVGASGFPVDTWTTLVANMPASKAPFGRTGGSEQFKASQTSATFDTRWEINYRSDMDPDLVDVPKLRRIVHQGRVYDITVANLIGRREGVELGTVAHG